jgi:hypothetical protein
MLLFSHALRLASLPPRSKGAHEERHGEEEATNEDVYVPLKVEQTSTRDASQMVNQEKNAEGNEVEGKDGERDEGEGSKGQEKGDGGEEGDGNVECEEGGEESGIYATLVALNDNGDANDDGDAVSAEDTNAGGAADTHSQSTANARLPVLRFDDTVVGMDDDAGTGGAGSRSIPRFEPWAQEHEGALQLNANSVLFTWMLVQFILMTGTVDILASFVTMMFLLAFCMLNFICLLLELTRPRYWRPSFRMYSKWTCGLGLAGSFLALLLSGEWYMGVGGSVSLAILLYWRRDDLIQMQREGESSSADRQSRVARVLGGGASIGEYDPDADDYPDGRPASFRGINSGFGGPPGGGGTVVRIGGGSTHAQSTHAQREAVLDTQSVEHSRTTSMYKRKVQRAAMYVRDAQRGRFRGAAWGDGADAHTQVLAKTWFHRLKMLRALNLAVFMSISFLERPSWCYQLPCTVNHVPGAHVPSTSQIPTVSIWASMGIEWFCLVLFMADMALKNKYMGQHAFLRDPWHMVQLALMSASLAGVLISAVQPNTLTMLNPILRPLLFVAMSRRVRKAFKWLLIIVPNFAEVTALVAYLVSKLGSVARAMPAYSPARRAVSL